MRNLKKILALVLALVMSLSLMATASAAETTAAGSADPYATAKEVLEGLKVYKGDAATGNMRYDSPITRAETAALVYRIATGDVDDTKAELHANHPFTADVAPTSWATPYISYGYNAGILKGVGGDGKHFNPTGSVTGYQTLAMILRAMGYGRNGEFEGSEWVQRTASKAQELGLLANVTPSDSVTLNQPATRGLVAELLFRAILKPMVQYSALNPYNYTPLTSKLADNLGLDDVTGVVVANRIADLYDTEPTKDGETRMIVDGKDYTINMDTDATAIGLTHHAYVKNGDVLGGWEEVGNTAMSHDGGERR